MHYFLDTPLMTYSHGIAVFAESVVGTISSLGARNARAEWEKIFNQAYLQPLLTVWMSYALSIYSHIPSFSEILC